MPRTKDLPPAWKQDAETLAARLVQAGLITDGGVPGHLWILILRAGLPDRLDPDQVLDVILFVRWHLRHLRSRDLSAICLHVGIELPDAHSAAGDAQATGLLLRILVERGHIPADFEQALAEQTRIAPQLEEEWSRWMYWLYRDRRDGQTLRMGCGKHLVRPLRELTSRDLTYYVEEIPDLPPDVRQLFEAQCAGRPLEAAG